MKTIVIILLLNAVCIHSQTLVGYWPFSGNTADSSGMGNHGTIVSGSGTVTLTTDRCGNPNSAYLFNNGRINIGTTGFPTGNGQRTLCAWFKRNSTPQTINMNIVGFGDNTTNGCRSYLAFDWPNTALIGNENRNAVNYFQWTADTNWHFMCAVFPQGATMSGQYLLYFDGVIKTDTSILPTTPLNTNTSDAAIGCLGTINNYFFQGKIDDVRIYSTALNDAQIYQLYGAPVIPALTAPSNNSSGISLTPLLDWVASPTASSYRVQLSSDSNFTTSQIDTMVSTDSLRVPSGKLTNNIRYYWRVRAANSCSISSPYAAKFSFTTSLVGLTPVGNEIPNEFSLSQNYPNPFNPSTNIMFDLPKYSFAKLIVYDLLGKVAAVLVNEGLNAGRYEVKFDAGNLSSGFYFYRLQTEAFTAVKKMILTK